MDVEKLYATLANIIGKREGLKINITLERREAECHICAKDIGTKSAMDVVTVMNTSPTIAPSAAKRF